MKTKFEIAFEFTAKWEGITFTDNPNDMGGPTKYGISLPTAQRLGLDKDLDGDVDADDIILLTPEDQLRVFKGKYWDRYGCEMAPMPLAVCLFDSLIMMNPKNPLLWYKQTKAHNDWKRFIADRRVYHIQVANKIPTNRVFLKGWLNRTNDLSKYCTILTAK